MMHLFNKNFFKFTTGFIGIIIIGLLGIILVEHFTPEDSEITATTDNTETDS